MTILVTGAGGFIGRNLTTTLENIREGKDKTHPLALDIEILSVTLETSAEMLDDYCARADVVVHLAGINRPKDPSEFKEGNSDFTDRLLALLSAHGGKARVILASSIQAALDNPYGLSKKSAEDSVFAYGEQHGTAVYVYRLPNVFGKWCQPNYNSAIATFCHRAARGEALTINDPSVQMTLVYIDDVIAEFIRAAAGVPNQEGAYCSVLPVHTASLGSIAENILSFPQMRRDLLVPKVGDALISKLYATYLSYLPKEDFSYPLNMHADARGSFTEFVRTPDYGQFSVNISKPHITKGEHWHHSKNEKFLVVSGKGVIRLRKVDEDEVVSYFVSGENPCVVDIPTGYTHNIENLGEEDMVTLMWASECFNPEKPDTFYLPV